MFDFEIESNDWIDVNLNGKPVKQLKNEQLKQSISEHLYRCFGIKMTSTNKYFTALDHNRDFQYLLEHKHLIYANTNQNIWLIALVTFGYKPVCLLIDKTNQNYYSMKYQFSRGLYKGTIFECEIVGTYLLISDFLVYMNKNISQYPMDNRLPLLQSILSCKNYHIDSFLDVYPIQIKDFIEYKYLESYTKDYMPTLPYYNYITGMIFRPNEGSNKNLIYNLKIHDNHHIHSTHKNDVHINENNDVEVNTDIDQSTKINTQQHPDVVFMLSDTGQIDDYVLKLYDKNGILIEYDYALVNDIKTSLMLQNMIDLKPNGFYVQCHYMPTFGKWKPIKVLDDNLVDHIEHLC